MSGNFYEGNSAIFRLIKEYEKHKSLIIAVDFDNTIYDTHNQGLNLQPTIELIKQVYALGFEVYCFTANNDYTLIRHIWARDLGIQNIKINESSLDKQFDSRKPFYSLLIDDRAGMSNSLDLLTTMLEYAS